MNKTLNDIRKSNLRYLLNKFGDSQRECAEKIKSSENYVSKLLSDDPDQRKNIGNNMVRRIEYSYNQPLGWMDVIHNDDETADNDPVFEEYVSRLKAIKRAIDLEMPGLDQKERDKQFRLMLRYELLIKNNL
ncbi:MAG: hypothetical protein ACXV7J_06785 [Methylomonas sp.]